MGRQNEVKEDIEALVALSHPKKHRYSNAQIMNVMKPLGVWRFMVNGKEKWPEFLQLILFVLWYLPGFMFHEACHLLTILFTFRTISKSELQFFH